MLSIAKTLVQYNDQQKWQVYKNQFEQYFQGLNKTLDLVVDFINEFNAQFQSFPTQEIFLAELQAIQASSDFELISKLVNSSDVPVYPKEEQFVSYLRITEIKTTERTFNQILVSTRNALDTLQNKSSKVIFEKADLLISNIQQLKQRSLRSEAASTSFLFGQSKELEDLYQKNVDENSQGRRNFYDLGLTMFDNILLKKGDLVTVGGFTSEGKSVLLRFMAHYLATHYALNVVFFSFEMSLAVVRMLFSLLHGGDKERFPDTPIVKVSDFKRARLSQEQYDFLFNYAEKDLLNNPQYGSILIEQPNKSRYRLSDLQERIIEIQNTIMPVDVLVLDYFSLMYPLASDRGQPDMAAFNAMLKEIKNFGLTFKDLQGNLKPLIILTAAQISRDAWNRAQKAEGVYDISCFANYSEIERSSDVLLTSYAPPDFRAVNKMRIQNHKNRDGEVKADPVDIFCQFGVAFNIYEVEHQTQQDLVARIKEIII